MDNYNKILELLRGKNTNFVIINMLVSLALGILRHLMHNKILSNSQVKDIYDSMVESMIWAIKNNNN